MPARAVRRPRARAPLRGRARPVLALLLALLAPLEPVAHAVECPVIAGGDPRLAEVDAAARMDFIRRQMDPAAHRARDWALGWGITYAILTVGQLAPTFGVDDRGVRADLYVGAATSGIGALFVAVAPPAVIRDRRRLRARLGAAGDPPSCEALAKAEAMMLREARGEEVGQGWLIHGGNLLVNTGLSLILGLGFDRWGSAFLNAGVGTFIGELMIWTQPRDMTRALSRYRSGRWAGSELTRSWSLHPLRFAGGGGLGLHGRF